MADVANMEKSKLDIIKFTNNPNIFAKHLDLSSLKSVRDFASEISKSEDKLDIPSRTLGKDPKWWLVGRNNRRISWGVYPLWEALESLQ
jgi:hypothetical protein